MSAPTRAVTHFRDGGRFWLVTTWLQQAGSQPVRGTTAEYGEGFPAG
jgi:hypothetical protein